MDEACDRSALSCKLAKESFGGLRVAPDVSLRNVVYTGNTQKVVYNETRCWASWCVTLGKLVSANKDGHDEGDTDTRLSASPCLCPSLSALTSLLNKGSSSWSEEGPEREFFQNLRVVTVVSLGFLASSG